MLKIAPAAKLDYFQILNARSFGLPDNASAAQIQIAYNHAQYLAEARISGWPSDLSDSEYAKRSNERRKLTLALYGFPEEQSDWLSQILFIAKVRMISTPRTIHDIVADRLPQAWNSSVQERLVAYENRCMLIFAKLTLGLLPWVTDRRLEDVQRENFRIMLAEGLNLQPSASFEKIYAVQASIGKHQHSQLLHRIFKASSEVSDSQLEMQLKPLAIALGYPKLRWFNCAGGRVTTADELLNAAAKAKLKVLPNGLAISPQ